MEGHGPGDAGVACHVNVLVAPDLVLTAAHCASYSPPGTDETYRTFNRIEVGKSDIGDKRVPFNPYSLETYKLYSENLIPDGLHPHPAFDWGSYEQDALLVKVFG